MYIIDDAWCYIKHFMFHKIQYSKHLKDDEYVKEFNIVLETMPRYNDYNAQPKRVYNKDNNMMKSMYHVTLPNSDILLSLIEYHLYYDKELEK